MPVFGTLLELGNGKKYETNINTNMGKNNNSDTNPIMNANKNNTDNESETRILTQEEVDEQIRNYIAPFTGKLEYLTQLTQGMCTAHRSHLSPRASTKASSSAAVPSPDIVRSINLVLPQFFFQKYSFFYIQKYKDVI